MINTQLPRQGTAARAVVDELSRRNITLAEATDVYRTACRNIRGDFPNQKYVTLTVTRILKKYGRQVGDLWYFGTKRVWRDYQVGDRVILTCNDVTRLSGTIDDRLVSRDSFNAGYWGLNGSGSLDGRGGLWPVTTDESLPGMSHKYFMCGADGQDLEYVVPTSDNPTVKFPIDCLVRYAGDPVDDSGIIGRVVGDVEDQFCRRVMWTTTGECEVVQMHDLELYRPEISKRPESQPEIPILGFCVGDRVSYVGPSESLYGKLGTVQKIVRNKRMVKWDDEHGGVSTESISDLRPAGFSVFKENDPSLEEPKQAATKVPESERTAHLRQKLEESIRRDEALHWARGLVDGMNDEQRRALVEVLDEMDLILRSADHDDDYPE